MDNLTYERKYDVEDATGFLAGVLLGGLAGAATSENIAGGPGNMPTSHTTSRD